MDHPRLTVTLPEDLPCIFPLASPTFLAASPPFIYRQSRRVPAIAASERVNGTTTCFFPRHFVTTEARDRVVASTWSDAQQGVCQGRPDVPLRRRLSIDTSTCRPNADQRIHPNAQVYYSELEQYDLYQRFCTLTPKLDAEEIIHESQNTSLTLAAFQSICQYGTAGWFTDAMVDTSFDILSRITRCEETGVSLVPFSMANQLYRIGKRIKKKEPDEGTDAELLGKLLAKSFLLIPISDGYQESVEVGDERDKYGASILPTVEVAGSHWTLLVVDCRRGDTLCCNYFDSLNPKRVQQTNNFEVTKHILLALKNVLGTRQRPSLTVAHEAPHQTSSQNRSHALDGGSACGPFIWEISRQICQHVADCMDDSTSDIDITLLPGFSTRRQWDSMETRITIRNLILRENRTRLWLIGQPQWIDDRKTGLIGWSTWLKGNGKPSHYFWDPRVPEVPLESELKNEAMELD